MNSRQRLLAALEHQPTDRVPISTYELVGYNSASFENLDPSYKELMDVIRAKTDCVCMWEPTAIPSSGPMPKGHGFIPVTGCPAPMEVEEERLEDNIITKKTVHTPQGPLTSTEKIIDNVHTVWHTERWCKSTADVDKALSLPFEPYDYDFSDYARIQAEVGDHGIIMSSIPDALCLCVELMEFADMTMWAMVEYDHFAKTIAQMHERNMENLRRMLKTQVVDLYRIYGPEYATPPYMPPDFFHQFVTPYVKDMVGLIHAHGAKARIHSHGKTAQVLDFILETGAHALDPCEGPPDGDITLAEVKQKTANQLCLFGNIQMKLLEHGDTAAVKAEVKSGMDAAKVGGGYVIMPTAAPINTPLSQKTIANYLTFIQTATELGQYMT